jgi:two-component system OmpR family response regulator
MRVLVVEDQRDVAELVTRALTREGHRVSSARSVAEADEQLQEGTYDLAVVDVGLPDGDGLEWCRQVRADGLALPILILTAKSAVGNRVAGLDAGADDFLAKPFAVAELRARIRALGRRGPIRRPNELDVGPVHLDFSGRRASLGGKEVPLTSREWNIVDLLIARRRAVVSRSEIIDALWGDDSPSAEASLEVLIGRIRKKLGVGFIRTVRGEGYAVD